MKSVEVCKAQQCMYLVDISQNLKKLKVCLCRCTLLSTRPSIENIESGFFPSIRLAVEIGDYDETLLSKGRVVRV